jgi:hypothetical protein
MNVDKIKVNITGVTPLLLHNGRTANPLDPYCKKMKSLVSKRSKTDEDHEEILDVQWEAALYFSERIGLYMPSENIFAAISTAARKHKLGQKSGGISLTEALGYPIVTANHLSLADLKADRTNRFYKTVNIQKSKTLSCRPIFNDWKMEFEFEFEKDIVDVNEIMTILMTLNSRVGFGVWRPSSPKPGSYGKFIYNNIDYIDHKGKVNNLWTLPS